MYSRVTLVNNTVLYLQLAKTVNPKHSRHTPTRLMVIIEVINVLSNPMVVNAQNAHMSNHHIIHGEVK